MVGTGLGSSSCPHCGGSLDKRSPISFVRDSEMFSDDDVALTGCLCYYSLSELEQMVAVFEVKFLKMLRERFPDMKKEQIILEAQKMPRHAPLRSAVLKKMGILSRVKEQVRVLTERSKEVEVNDGMISSIRDKGIKGEDLSTMEWLKSYSQNK